jgi:hypothetical protein
LRTGKAEGSYEGFDFETEIEHGVTDSSRSASRSSSATFIIKV